MQRIKFPCTCPVNMYMRDTIVIITVPMSVLEPTVSAETILPVRLELFFLCFASDQIFHI